MMVVVAAELDEEINRKAQVVLALTGVSASTVIQKMFTRIAEDGALPFEPFEPNDETIRAIEAARRGEGKVFNTLEDLFAELHADD
jgi:DNA-damage-inducible protein J